MFWGKSINFDTRDNLGKTPFVRAYIKIETKKLSNYWFSNAKDIHGRTLLISIEYSAIDNHGLTPYLKAYTNGHKEIVKFNVWS